MGDYQLKYYMSEGNKRSGPQTVEMGDMPKLAVAQTEARDKLADMQLKDPFGITITSAMVRRLPAGNWHRV